MSELFTSCYVEEGISNVFVQVLRKKGFVVKTAEELNTIGASDYEHLSTAIDLKSTLITDDKKTFLIDSKATSREHYGIIIVSKQFSKTRAASAAKLAIDKYLNRYTKDEWKKLIVYL